MQLDRRPCTIHGLRDLPMAVRLLVPGGQPSSSFDRAT
jgi:hypothetical protein